MTYTTTILTYPAVTTKTIPEPNGAISTITIYASAGTPVATQTLDGTPTSQMTIAAPTAAGSAAPTAAPTAAEPSAHPSSIISAPATALESSIISASSTSGLPSTSVTSAGAATSTKSSVTSKTAATPGSSPSSPVLSSPIPGASKSRLSSGAVAGVAIGTLLIGAILAALAVFFLMKKRSGAGGHRRKHSRSSGGLYGGDEEKRVGGPAEIILSENLLERADDSQIKQQMVDLNEVIDQHCVNHYLLEPVVASQGDWEKRLNDAGYSRLNKSGPTSAEMANLLQNPRSRLAAIHHLIALVILSHIDWRTGADVSLLPPQIASFCRTIPPVEKQAGSQAVFDKAFSSWKQLSAFLIEPFRSNRESPKADRNELVAPIGRNVAQINAILAPFVKSSRHQEENLSAIVFGAAQLGILLFSQPNEWVFFWEAAREDAAAATSRKTVGTPFVVFPALAEKMEKRGEIRNRVVVEAKQVNI